MVADIDNIRYSGAILSARWSQSPENRRLYRFSIDPLDQPTAGAIDFIADTKQRKYFECDGLVDYFRCFAVIGLSTAIGSVQSGILHSLWKTHQGKLLVIGQRYNLQFETPGLPRLPRLRDSQDSGTPGRLMEKVKATSRKFHSSPNHFQVQIQA